MPLIFSILDKKATVFKCIDTQMNESKSQIFIFVPFLLLPSILSIWASCLTSYRSQRYRHQYILLKGGKMAWQA